MPPFLRHARFWPFRLAVFSIVAAALVWTVLPDADRLNEFRDVHHLFMYERSAIDTIRQFHELPLWNPYYCGGFDAVGAPQTRFMSPTILLGLLFGAERAEILTVFFMSLLGMEGMYRWLRLRVDDAAAAMLVAPVFVLSGQFAVAYFRGWIQFFGFDLLPWILFGINLAVRRRVSGIALASLGFAMLIGFAGFFAVPLLTVAAAIESGRAFFAEPREKRFQSFAMLTATVLFMATVACVRLWPVAETMVSAPRIMAGAPGHLPRALLSALVSPLVLKDGNTDMEGSFYTGPAFLGIAVLGTQYRRGFTVLLVGLFCAWIAAGYSPLLSPFAGLRALPVFEAVRYPERFLWLTIFFASELAGQAVSRVPQSIRGKKLRWATWAMLAAVLVWTMASQIGAFQRIAAARQMGVVTEEPTADFHQTRGNRWRTVHFESIGLGSLGCYETHRMAQSTLLRGDLPAEEYLAPENSTAGSVKRVSWSPNRIVVHANLRAPARLLVNQNWAPGWHASTGTIASNAELLAVDLPAGERDVTLTFLPWATSAGAGVTCVALACLALLGWRAHRRDLFSKKARVVTAALVILPCVLAGVAVAGSPDPKWPKPALANPNGAPAFVTSDEEAHLPGQSIQAKFDLPLRIETVNVSKLDGRKNVAIELYLERTGYIPHSTTMFVHLVRRKDQGPVPKGLEGFFNADHQVMSGSFFLSDMPEGKLMRDVFGSHLGKGASGVWDIWIAFGHVSGGRGRVKLLDAGKSEGRDDMLKIGEVVVP